MDGKTVSEAITELNGKSYADGYVYVNFGALPNVGDKQVSFTLPDGSQYWIENAWCTNGISVYNMPNFDVNNANNNISIFMVLNTKTIKISTKGNWGTYMGHIIIGYKK